MYVIEAEGVLSYFLGDWRIHRVISGFGEITGQAMFQLNNQNDKLLNYKEAVTLPSPSNNQKPNAFREYEYVMTDTGFDIFFSDGATKGELFLSFEFIHASILTSHHLCIKDHYDAKFEFLSGDEFQLSFTVNGPKKDYSIQTCFTRL
ncbi:DUF6314 family protein [Marinomonas colpomeniae]|uniref:DUF6314 domain-containing protein n=1 Tax=Marinomonas colpomeniae TaxID=2774408 RepID=A0ABR8P354_9GAMM|nr:DUF6314 family protein [Marinomonas colpomeniae]MBD5772722.1 hypothetical protein [Marinomonas colpomeniae]